MSKVKVTITGRDGSKTTTHTVSSTLQDINAIPGSAGEEGEVPTKTENGIVWASGGETSFKELFVRVSKNNTGCFSFSFIVKGDVVTPTNLRTLLPIVEGKKFPACGYWETDGNVTVDVEFSTDGMRIEFGKVGNFIPSISYIDLDTFGVSVNITARDI